MEGVTSRSTPEENTEQISETLNTAIDTRRKCVQALEELATAFDKASRDSGERDVIPCLIGTIGGLWDVIRGGAEYDRPAPVVSDLSAVLQERVAVWKIENIVGTRNTEKELVMKLADKIKEDLIATRELEITLQALASETATGPFFKSANASEVLEILQAGRDIFFTHSSGVAKSESLLIQEISKVVFHEINKDEAGEKAQAVSEVFEEYTKRDTVIKIAQEGMVDAAGVLKTAAGVTGDVAVVFGALMVMLGGINTYMAHQKAVADTCPMGDCLREIAAELQQGLDQLERYSNNDSEK